MGLGNPVAVGEIFVIEVVSSATLQWGSHNYTVDMGNAPYSSTNPNIMGPLVGPNGGFGLTGVDGMPESDDDSHTWTMIGGTPFGSGLTPVYPQARADGFDGTQDYTAKITLTIKLNGKKAPSIAKPKEITYQWTQTQSNGTTHVTIKRNGAVIVNANIP